MRTPAIVALTGAGVSADSGVATFRGPDGLWEGRRVDEVATPAGWHRDPAFVWRFYQERRAKLSTVQPNPAHHALAKLEREVVAAGGDFTLITQNVDDLHERAGSERLLHMHGELARLVCEVCGGKVHDLERTDPEEFLPCAACGHERLRPDVVWFGEIPYHLEAIERALIFCTHFLAIGTSGVVYPAAGLLAAARAGGARTWVLSLERPDNVHPEDVYVEGRASETVPRLVGELAREWG